MYDRGSKFKYFYYILKEVYTIIEINFKLKNEDTDKLIGIIRKHLNIYNSQNSVRMGVEFDTNSKDLTIFLSDFVSGRGQKKLFEDTINITTIIRQKLIDIILAMSDEIQ